MDVAERVRCAVGGILLSAPAVLGLGFVSYLARTEPGGLVLKLVSPPTPSAFIVVLPGVALLCIGLFPCVKAIFNPPHFWKHTAMHLGVAFGLAWALTIALSVGFAFLP